MTAPADFLLSSKRLKSNGGDMETHCTKEKTLSSYQQVSTPSVLAGLKPSKQWVEERFSHSIAIPVRFPEEWSSEFKKEMAAHETHGSDWNGSIGMHQKMNGRCQLLHRVGRGSFGEVFKALDVRTGSTVAVKMEDGDKKSLKHERDIYATLWKVSSQLKGVPRPFYYGSHQGKNVLVMDFLGESLKHYLTNCGRSFSMKTVMMIGIQVLERLQAVHERHIIHCDIKPENILMGNGDGQMLYLADFGLARSYRDAATNKHIPWKKERNGVVGTAAFASVSSHRGIALSRRDDLISLGYLLVHLFKGVLPWVRVQGSTRTEKFENMRKVKEVMSLLELCKGMPRQMVDYFLNVEELYFTDKPDYDYLKGLFEAALMENSLQNDGVFDWMSPTPLPLEE